MDLNNVDTQMKLFQEGGIVDDGMNRDPVSGNEVPPGSLASEVRDDVDAKLSDGEYVVPADVVRFFGVDYFEKLRKKAKAGLADMEADGRIGGEPMPEDLEGDEDFPFSDEELMSFDEEEPIEMAEGGSVASKFNPQAFQPGFSFGMTPGGTGGVVTKTYRNAAGEIKSIMFVNGQPIQSIPSGFYEDTPENRDKFKAPETTVTPVSETVSEQPERSGGPGQEFGSEVESTGTPSSFGSVDIGTPMGGYGKVGTTGATVLGGLAGLTVGGVKGAVTVAKAGKEAGEFNDSRNDLVSAVKSGNLSDISTAAKALEKQHESLSRVGKLATGTSNMTAKDVVNAVGYGAQGEGTSTRGEFGYGLTEAEQSAASSSRGGMDSSSAGYVDPYSEGFGPGGVNTAGGGGGGGGSKVICTALNSLGLLPDDVYKLDQEFGRLADLHDPALTRGYRRWATPVAEYIKKDTLLSKLTRYAIKPLANAWAKEMAHQMDPANYRGSVTGKLIMAIGHPICRKLGKE
jgi:hypothetical protein